MEAVKKVYKEVPKSPRDDRLYRGLEMKNNMKVLVISDTSTDKAAAAMDVHIGEIIVVKIQIFGFIDCVDKTEYSFLLPLTDTLIKKI